MFATTAVAIPLCLASTVYAFASSETQRTNNARSYAGLPIPHVAKRQIVSDEDYPDFNVLHHLTGISPYFDSPGVGLQPEPPQGCNVTSAAYLIRHGNIYANDFDFETYIEPFIEKIGNVSDKSVFANTPLSFLSNWENPLSNTSLVSMLTPSGAKDAETLGSLVKTRYPTMTNNITVWASSAERTVDSANAFIKGLGQAQLQEVYEGKNDSANSLTPHKSCSNFDASKGSEESGNFRKIYAEGPIKRFNALVPSLKLTDTDIFAMQQLCGYETVIKNSSDFCNEGLFTPNEWLGFEYAQDIMYAHSLGYGLDFSAEMGMPWLKASVDLLTITETLPQKLFVSFTHREEPAFAMTALGLFNDSAYSGGTNVAQFFPTDHINYERAWKSSEILPFLGHVAIERLTCPQLSSGTDYIRVLVNSAPIPLPGPTNLQTGPDGTTPVQDFVNYIQGRASTHGDFVGKCGVSGESNATNTLSLFENTFGVQLSSSSPLGNGNNGAANGGASGQGGDGSNGASALSFKSTFVAGVFAMVAALTTL